MITLKLKIGKGVIEVQAEDMKTIHKFSSIYGGLPEVCDNCKSEKIYLSYRDTKEGFKYYSIQCKECGAVLNLGQKKEGGFFLKAGEKMQIYKLEKSNNIPQASDEARGYTEDDKIEF